MVLLGTAAIVNGSGAHLYVIDGRGDQALTVFERSPSCGGVVRLHERERVVRLINRVADELARRIADPTAPRHPIVVLIDEKEVDDPNHADGRVIKTLMALYNHPDGRGSVGDTNGLFLDGNLPPPERLAGT